MANLVHTYPDQPLLLISNQCVLACHFSTPKYVNAPVLGIILLAPFPGTA